ncbi:MAG: flagellar hook capping FlgD N-terminal domain-containing protein, partial [Acidobacteriaceae bacterium]
QDPTSQTDPNEYINQLVGVNSLEQLVDINQDLSGTASTTSGTGTGSTSAVSGATAATPGPAAASGNLSAPVPGNAAAVRVASALGGTTSQSTPLPSSAATAGNRFDSIVAALRSRAAAKPTTINPAR